MNSSRGSVLSKNTSLNKIPRSTNFINDWLGEEAFPKKPNRNARNGRRRTTMEAKKRLCFRKEASVISSPHP